jgi:AraC family transcriptional regulator
MKNGADDLYAESAAAWFASHVLVHEKSFGLDSNDRSAGEISDGRLRRVIDFIAAHFSEPITLDQLAVEAGISKYHFTRLFRQKTGQSPFRFLRETRLREGRKMLLTTNLSVGTIAMACGYSAASHFTTAFTHRHGTSPTDYRASYQA